MIYYFFMVGLVIQLNTPLISEIKKQNLNTYKSGHGKYCVDMFLCMFSDKLDNQSFPSCLCLIRTAMVYRG